MDNKITLRTKAKNIRKSLDMITISNLIVSNIKEFELYQNANNIMIYYPISNEVNLLSLLNDSKQFYLPRVNGENIECCKYNLGDNLVLSELNIYEPDINSKPINPQILDLIFVPALAVNNRGYRLGYGKGFYDRFLAEINVKTIIAIPEELIFDNIYEEIHDIKCDILITQKKASFERG